MKTFSVGENVTVKGAKGWPDLVGTIEVVDGRDYMVRFGEKHVGGSTYDGWPWALVRRDSRRRFRFVSQVNPDWLTAAEEQQIVDALGRGESVAELGKRPAAAELGNT